ncbi:DUF1097 domain-containing protein [Erwinia sp. 9145]|uniref:DUF1097 domain-containing protein n=1 Tax=Erwinia sp. 9145 TaxID=1500895 RepID=UPI0005581521|nr:DUF1097 domain-containing protein [Erwinia sp. 9145]
MVNNGWGKHLRIVLGESFVASSAATIGTLVFEVPVWAMFIGWIAFFTRGLNLRSGLVNLACVLIGLLLGIAAANALPVLGPLLGAYAISVVVVVITAIALSLARAPVFNNLLAFFLGLVAWFAAHLPPSPGALFDLGLAATLGTLAGFLAHAWQRHVNTPSSTTAQ